MVTEIGKISEVTEAAGPKMTIQVCRTSERTSCFGRVSPRSHLCPPRTLRLEALNVIRRRFETPLLNPTS
jgi:hypothetical protein